MRPGKYFRSNFEKKNISNLKLNIRIQEVHPGP